MYLTRFIAGLLVLIAFGIFTASKISAQNQQEQTNAAYQDLTDNKARIKEVESRIKDIQEVLSVTDTERKNAHNRVTEFVLNEDRLATKAIILENMLRLSGEEHKKLKKELDKLNHEVSATKQEIKKLVFLMVRLVKMAEASPVPTNRLKREPLKYSHIVRELSADRVDKVKALSDLRQRQELLIKKLAAKETEINAQISANKKLINDIQANRAKFERYLDELGGKSKSNRRTLAQLENQKKNLEEQLNRLWEIYLSSRKNRKTNLKGFQAAENSRFLYQPISGKIITPFGATEQKIKGSRFKGILLEPTAAKPVVHAAYSGTVSYITQLRGFGNVIIIDHGNSDYTIYGMLGEVTAVSGNFVNLGDPLGIAGTDADGNPRMYFEVRINKTPSNPAKYIQNYNWR